MKLYTDFGMIIQEELKEDKKTKFKYSHNPPTDRNVATTIPIIIRNDDHNATLDKY
jgi:hypothetical protein